MNDDLHEQIKAALASATVHHLQPDDVIVFALDRDIPLSPELTSRVRESFGDRRIVVLAKGVQFGVDRNGAVTRADAIEAGE